MMNSDDPLSIGIAAWKAGDIGRARILISQVVKENPHSVEGWFWLGRCQPEVEKSFYCFRRALQLDPGYTPARHALEDLKTDPKAPDAASSPSFETNALLVSPLSKAPKPEASPSFPGSEPVEKPLQPAQPVQARATAPASRKGRIGAYVLLILLGVVFGLLLFGGPLVYLALNGGLDFLNPAQVAGLPAGVQASPSPSQTITPSPTHTSTELPTPTRTPTLRPTWTISVTEDYSSRYQSVYRDIYQAQELMKEKKYAEAIPHWDVVLMKVPEYAKGYFQRGKCYLRMTEGQRVFSEYSDYTQSALKDLDQAIAIGPASGDYYLERNNVYEALIGMSEQRADNDFLERIALENLQMAVAMGNSDPNSPRTVAFDLYYLGRCTEAQAITQTFLEAQKPNRPDPILENLQWINYLVCTHEEDKALQHIDASLKLKQDRHLLYRRAVVLYYLGRKREALEQINQTIEKWPDFWGYRYYLRALIYYDMGKTELAQQDIETGEGNTWGRGGIRPYVLGLLALDAGNRDEGIAFLQYAEATLGRLDSSLIDRIRQELTKLGAQLLEPVPEITLQVTPLVIPTSRPTPRPLFTAIPPKPTSKVITPTRAPEDEIKVPVTSLDALIVDMQIGTGPFVWRPNDYPLFRFQPQVPIQVQSVVSLSFKLIGPIPSGDTPLALFLWNPKGGGWNTVALVWGDNPIPYPSRYVFPEGDIYAAIDNPSNQTIQVDNAGFSLIVRTTDGAVVSYGLK
jgi:tetratricopeptide (TPR) repeat protein